MRSLNFKLINTYTLKLLSTSILSILLGFTPLAADVDSAKLTKIKEEGPITSTQKIEDKVWPEVTVKAFIPAGALESAAIFAAFDYQHTYIPNLTESEVVKEILNNEEVKDKKNEIHVRYIMDMPWPISDSEYINGHSFSKDESKKSYQVNWFMVKSDSAEELKGSASFSPFPGDEENTLMIYKAHVTPKSFMAGALRKFMIRDVKASVQATVDEVKKLKKEDSKFLKKYSDIFLDILSGKQAYLLKS